MRIFYSIRLLAGILALSVVTLGGERLTAAFSDTRIISFSHIHTNETLTVTYKRNGRYVPEAMDQIDWIMRDWRRNEKTKMDPHTIDILWEMHAELGSKEPISIICGYRSRNTNEMLRRTVGGQASESQHITGKAIDVTFPDVPLKQIRYSALIREQGGVGYYPTSGIPFVHVDTGRVRHWPRLPRYELALLFPNGSSQHHPAEGGDITRDDVRIAQAQHKDLATQIAGFFTLRETPKTSVMVADAGSASMQPVVAPPVATLPGVPKPAKIPPPTKVANVELASLTPASAPVNAAVPKLLAPPKLVERPSKFQPGPSKSDRSELMTLVSFVSDAPAPKLLVGPAVVTRRPRSADGANIGALPAVTGASGARLQLEAPTTPRTTWTQVAALDPATFGGEKAGSKVLSDASGWSNGWVHAPAYDDEHPEELSYRPFPLAPLLTASASLTEPVLSRLTPPDVAKILSLIDKPFVVPEMSFSPGQQTAEMMWSQQFKGEKVQFVDTTYGEGTEDVPTGLIPRAVRTTKSN